ncbi:MAG: hypothetical protein MUD10_00735 [Candidatus Pacebacteria bacterium]|jgi:hypothetical protein|nr:hypothetical protein [Candidatus Paceibacterota bacterium]
MKILETAGGKTASLIEKVCDDATADYHPIPLSNGKKVKEFLGGHNCDGGLVLVEYEKGDEVVREGVISGASLKIHPELSYCQVPLGFILKGKITVIKNHKGIKELGEGDFLGLFETGDFLLTDKNRQIGDWSLVADTGSQVLYLGKSALKKTDNGAEAFRDYLIEMARTDHVPQPITDLPLLDWVANHTTGMRPSDCAVIAHTHLLPNNKPLFRHLSALVDFGNIYVLDKPYSTVRRTFNEMVLAGFEVVPVKVEPELPYEFSVKKSVDVLWRKVIDDQKKRNFKKILIADDGGDIWWSIPWKELSGVKIAVVEQTERGITRLKGSNTQHPPIISVASAGIKKNVEGEFIGISVVKKLKDLGALDRSRQAGIVGMGCIGLAISKALKEYGMEALSYDPLYHSDPSAFLNACGSLDALFNKCDLIIGTTGTDALKGVPWERVITGEKVLASASSADIEFGSLLKIALPHTDPFGTIEVPVHDRLSIKILNGGYPVNFDRDKDTTPDEDIVLTRCLMYIGAMQALELIDRGSTEQCVYNLDKLSQSKLLEKWIIYKKSLNQEVSFTKENIQKIVDSTFLEGGKDMPSVWRD